MSSSITPVILTAKELTVEYGEQKVLDKASISIHEGDRIGLVGRNGAGKSTFLKIISGKLTPDSGEINSKRGLVTGFLTQEFVLNEETTVYENIISGAEAIVRLLREYENLPAEALHRHEVEEKINSVDGWNLERKIDILISSLSAPEKDRKVNTLSGGEKRRVSLCQALISEPELLILDEPTNHLDTDSIEWLENFLGQYKGTCIFVTHDRYFLDRIATRIVELSNGGFYSHDGNYTDYLINKSMRQSVQETENRKRENFLRRELDWVMTGPRARRTKSKSRLERYYEIADQKVPEAELEVSMIIPPADALGTKVLELTDLEMQLGGRTLFEMFSYTFQPGRRIGIVGKNGMGKTTLLKIILGELMPTRGSIETGERTQFNYVDQARLTLNDDDSVLQAISEGSEIIKFGKETMPVWTYLRRFLFTDDRIQVKVGKLSGGERSRLTLAKILKNGGNFLMLDEPTNDLDLPTLRVLEEALLRFKGCVVVVSHDRYFLNRICDCILAFEGGKYIQVSEGDYDYYIEKRTARLKNLQSISGREKKPDTRTKQPPKKLSWKEERELEEIEEKILAAEAEVLRIENIFSSPDFYEKHAASAAELNRMHQEAQTLVRALYERWEELENKKEQPPAD